MERIWENVILASLTMAVALFAFGLMTRDGLYILAGFAYAGVFAGLGAVWLI